MSMSVSLYLVAEKGDFQLSIFHNLKTSAINVAVFFHELLERVEVLRAETRFILSFKGTCYQCESCIFLNKKKMAPFVFDISKHCLNYMETDYNAQRKLGFHFLYFTNYYSLHKTSKITFF